MNKLKFNDLKNIKNKNNSLTAQIFLNLQNYPTFHSTGKVGQFCKKKRVLCLSICITSLWAQGMELDRAGATVASTRARLLFLAYVACNLIAWSLAFII